MKNKMKKYVKDIFENLVKIWDDENTPDCEVCSTPCGRKARKAKLKYSIESALKKKNPFQTIPVDPLTHSKLVQPRPNYIPNGHAYACAPCYNTYLTKQRQEGPNTLQFN